MKKWLISLVSALMLTMYAGSMAHAEGHQNGWELASGKWYYFDHDAAKTGWFLENGHWYYLGQDGAMQTGWVKTSGKWYFLDRHGVMQTGWVQDGGKWYYLNPKGDMKVGWLELGNTAYYLDSHGAMVTGWKWINENWYYFETSGLAVKGWKSLGGSWYYFDKIGYMMMHNNFAGGYYLTGSGKMSTAGSNAIVLAANSLKKTVDVGTSQKSLVSLLGSQHLSGKSSEGYNYWTYYLKVTSSGAYQAVSTQTNEVYETLGTNKANIRLTVYWNGDKAFNVVINYFDANHKFHQYETYKQDYVYN